MAAAVMPSPFFHADDSQKQQDYGGVKQPVGIHSGPGGGVGAGDPGGDGRDQTQGHEYLAHYPAPAGAGAFGQAAHIASGLTFGSMADSGFFFRRASTG